jgi:hypothetical protein
MKESYKKGASDSILALSLAGGIARCRLKRRQGYRWAGRLSFGMSRKERERLMCSVGGKPTEAKVRNLVAWIGGKRETESLKSIDKAIFRMASKSSGRNESKRKVASKNSHPKGRNLRSWVKAVGCVAN